MSPWTLMEERKKFRDDDLFQFLSQGNEIKYITNVVDNSLQNQRSQLATDFGNGVVPIAFLRSGLNLELPVIAEESSYDLASKRFLIHSRFILDGVHVVFKGYLCGETLSGVGRIEFDDRSNKSS